MYTTKSKFIHESLVFWSPGWVTGYSWQLQKELSWIGLGHHQSHSTSSGYQLSLNLPQQTSGLYRHISIHTAVQAYPLKHQWQQFPVDQYSKIGFLSCEVDNNFPSLVPMSLPDLSCSHGVKTGRFFLHGCEIKSGSGLGIRLMLSQFYMIAVCNIYALLPFTWHWITQACMQAMYV